MAQLCQTCYLLERETGLVEYTLAKIMITMTKAWITEGTREGSSYSPIKPFKRTLPLFLVDISVQVSTLLDV